MQMRRKTGFHFFVFFPQLGFPKGESLIDITVKFLFFFFPKIGQKGSLLTCRSISYHFIIFRGQLEDTSQLGIHEIIRFCIFPLVEMRKGHVIH